MTEAAWSRLNTGHERIACKTKLQYSPAAVNTDALLVLHGHLNELALRNALELVVDGEERKRRSDNHRSTAN